jgi:hypothetical protein
MASTPSDPARSDPTEALIGGQYAVSLAHPLPGTGGGLASFAVVGHPGLMAVQALRQSPARWRPLQTLSFPLENVLGPVAHGVAPALPEPGFPAGRPTTGYFVISRAPQGPSVAADLHPWREAELLDLLLRPIARGLEQLHSVGITHRAIRPDNVFQSAGQPAILGAAWSAPPAALQPSIFEPPYAAICLPTGRGEGMPADDIYALGVLLLTLALGRVPLANLDDAAVLHRKLEFGSYAALVGQERLSPAIAELIRACWPKIQITVRRRHCCWTLRPPVPDVSPRDHRGGLSDRWRLQERKSGVRVRLPMPWLQIRCTAFRRCARAGWIIGSGIVWGMPDWLPG